MPALYVLPAPYDQLVMALAFALPLLLACLALIPRLSHLIAVAAPLAVVPALVLCFCEPAQFTWDAVILTSSFAIRPFHAVWLLVTSMLWLASAWYGVYYLAHDKEIGRYLFFFLGAMAGNIGLILAADPISFFTFFALMSFLSYGLVVHDGTPDARRAGRVYLSMAVLGEVMQFAALSMLVFPMIGNSEPITFQSLERSSDPVIVTLLIAGFGIKAGLFGLHVWLPMAHPVAPTPASAVLSGSMIKAGLLGWLTLLPLGNLAMSMPTASAFLIGLGLTGALVAALLGVLQTNAKAVLAYSSVSQMGLIITAVGVSLGEPRIFPVMKWIILVYVAHHAFAKCLLFLSVGLKTSRPLLGLERSVVWGGTTLAALTLAGAPFTGGMIAKALIKDAMNNSALVHIDWIVRIFIFAAAGTTLLMIRFLLLMRRMRFDDHHAATRGIIVPWLLLLGMIIGFTHYVSVHLWEQRLIPVTPIYPSMKQVWPLLLGLIFYGAFGAGWKRSGWPALRFPPGDLYHGLAFSGRLVADGLTGWSRSLDVRPPVVIQACDTLAHRVMAFFQSIESSITRWRYGGLALALVIFLVVWWSVAGINSALPQP